ncbi:MAG: M23 family metallopeptidase [Oceanospirillaceae bacterium]|nr:M23 family metallopeptidase [Oceanospirillaceae bacterium]MCP5349429.1 M23 family metallopeptidase [Oceanospirillaceae bacterium]
MVALATQNPHKSKPINLKQSQPKQGAAAFIMGLNNRVVRIDQRLTRLEKQHDHLQRTQFSPMHIIFCILGVALISACSSVYLSLQLRIPSPTNAPQASLNTAKNSTEQIPAPAVSSNAPHTSRPAILWPLEQGQIPGQNIQYPSIKHGISIPAKLGDAVVAVDSGQVIYSGNGIADYGNLILIQHENDLISVYGNTYQAFIREGDEVEKGQLIAAAGEISGKAALYFELRFKGTPEDPFNYYAQ